MRITVFLCFLFAGDLRIYMAIECDADTVLFQRDSENLHKWNNQNGIFFNV